MGDGIQQFEDLEVWQLARQQVTAIYTLFESDTMRKDFGLKDQITRAAVSVMSNVAEGFERSNLREKAQFYNIARASNGEVRSLLYVVSDVYSCLAEPVGTIRQTTIKVGKLLSGLIRSTSSRISEAS